MVSRPPENANTENPAHHYRTFHRDSSTPIWWMESMTSRLYCINAAACYVDNPSGSSSDNVWNSREPVRANELPKLFSQALQK